MGKRSKVYINYNVDVIRNSDVFSEDAIARVPPELSRAANGLKLTIYLTGDIAEARLIEEAIRTTLRRKGVL